MDCPKCRLINPPNAVTCDCGYNFVTRTVDPISPERQHQKEENVKTPLQTFAGLTFCLMILRTLIALEHSSAGILILTAIAMVTIGGLTWAVYQRSNAARITLMILTFPIGVIFMSKDIVKRHCTGQ